MSRLIFFCVLSFLAYIGIVTCLADRPLSLGLLQLELSQKAGRLRQLPSPKLIILAGSNGPYSHSCKVIQAILDMPCENAGIAVGFGLDDIFAQYEPYISAGDVVYMPMEFQQYTATRSDYDTGPDSAMLIRHNRTLLMRLPPGRIIGALLCCDLADFLEASIEMPLARLRIMEPSRILGGEYNPQGDRVDNSAPSVTGQIPLQPQRQAPSAQAISSGYGTAEIAAFIKGEEARDVIVIGGLPSNFDTVQQSLTTISEIKMIYVDHGGQFMMLPNHSQYPPADFFNSEDHLTTQCQFFHSILVAEWLARKLHRRALPPPQQVILTAAACPSAPANFAERSDRDFSQADVQNNF